MKKYLFLVILVFSGFESRAQVCQELFYTKVALINASRPADDLHVVNHTNQSGIEKLALVTLTRINISNFVNERVNRARLLVENIYTSTGAGQSSTHLRIENISTSQDFVSADRPQLFLSETLLVTQAYNIARGTKLKEVSRVKSPVTGETILVSIEFTALRDTQLAAIENNGSIARLSPEQGKSSDWQITKATMQAVLE